MASFMSSKTSFTVFVILALCGLVAHAQGRPRINGVCGRQARGCVVSRDTDPSFRALFARSCDYLDLCYECGSIKGHTRESCNALFYSHLSDVCRSIEPHRQSRCFSSIDSYVSSTDVKTFMFKDEAPYLTCSRQLRCIPHPMM